MLPRLTSALLALVSLGVLVAYTLVSLEVTPRDSLPVWFTKPLLMPALLAWLFVRVRGRALPEIRVALVHASLVCATLGDVLLIHASKATFVMSVAAFALAHVAYVGALLRVRHLRLALRSAETLGLLALVAYGYLVASIIRGGLPPEREAFVAVYSGFVTATVASASLRFVARGDRSSASILAGAVLFLQSDSLIAVSVSGRRLPFAPLAIMATYIAGQFLIARGVTLASDPRPGDGEAA